MKIKKKIVIMDIIIVLLVLVNACMIIAIKQNSDNINVDSKTYFLMKLYGEDEYGKAVDYAQKYSLKLEENKKNATQDFKCICCWQRLTKIVTDGTEYGRCTKKNGGNVPHKSKNRPHVRRIHGRQ